MTNVTIANVTEDMGGGQSRFSPENALVILNRIFEMKPERQFRQPGDTTEAQGDTDKEHYASHFSVRVPFRVAAPITRTFNSIASSYSMGGSESRAFFRTLSNDEAVIFIPVDMARDSRVLRQIDAYGQNLRSIMRNEVGRSASV